MLMDTDKISARAGYNIWGVVTFVGLSHDYPELSTWLDENLIPEFAEEFWSAENMSIADITKKYMDIVTCDYLYVHLSSLLWYQRQNDLSDRSINSFRR